MGFNTSYLGRLDIAPRLNPAEVEWLRAFRLTERALHPKDPYAVPMHPRAAWSEHLAALRDGGREQPRDVVGLWRCDWEPCVEGCCLRWATTEKSNHAVQELGYLIDHFLRPGAEASRDGRPDFGEFTFDHVVSGVVAAERDDTRELFLIVADRNELSTRVLVRGDPMPWG